MSVAGLVCVPFLPRLRRVRRVRPLLGMLRIWPNLTALAHSLALALALVPLAMALAMDTAVEGGEGGEQAIELTPKDLDPCVLGLGSGLGFKVQGLGLK